MKIEEHSKYKNDNLSLVGRVVHFYRFFNRRDWGRCHDYIDPKLKEKVEPGDYSQTMEQFFSEYGPIQQIRIRRLTIYPGNVSKTDERDFAYVIIAWKDRRDVLHQFRERWIKDRGRWFTRVVGLVPHQAEN